MGERDPEREERERWWWGGGERQNGGEIRGKTEKRREAEKLASGHCMTNKGTALQHCRKPLEKKRSAD